jgi:hypothetical protein
LSEFGKCSLALTELLEQDMPLDMVEEMFIENHIRVIQLAYGAWKRRNVGDESKSFRGTSEVSTKKKRTDY